MKNFTGWGRLFALLSILLLGACSDGSSGTAAPASSTLSGTAASGAPLVGATVTVTGANGISVSVTTNAAGDYSATGTFTYPTIITATSGATTYFSWATAAGIANVTPLTTAALTLNADLPNNLNDVAASWAATYAAMTTPANTQAAQAIVNANFATQINAILGAGAANTYNFLTAAFSANGTGIDLVMDGLNFTFNNNAGTFTIALDNGTPVPFNPNIPTAGFTIGGGTGGGGAGGACATPVCLTITGTVTTSGFTITIPATTVSGLPANGVPTVGSVGDLQTSIQTAYGALGTISNFSYTIQSSTATQTVARLTFSVVSAIAQVPSASYDLTYTYDLAAGGGTTPVGGGSGTISGAITAPLNLTMDGHYMLTYSGVGSSVGSNIGIDFRSGFPLRKTLGSSGGLIGYDTTTDLTTNANTRENVLAGTNSIAELGGDANITWGRWNGGTASGNNYGNTANWTFASNQGFHYVLGVATATPTTGVKTYNLSGNTLPTQGSGALGTFTGTMKIDYSTNKVGVSFTVTMPDRTYTVASNGGLTTLTNSELTLMPNDTSFSNSADTIFGSIPMSIGGTACTAGNCLFTFDGMVVASSARVGGTYMIWTSSPGAGSVHGAAVFTEAP